MIKINQIFNEMLNAYFAQTYCASTSTAACWTPNVDNQAIKLCIARSVAN